MALTTRRVHGVWNVCGLYCNGAQFRNTLYLGANRQYLIQLHDPAHDNYYSKVSAAIIPCGFVFVPLVSWIVTRHGFLVSAHVVNGVGMAYGALACVPILWIQPVVTVLYVTLPLVCVQLFVWRLL